MLIWAIRPSLGSPNGGPSSPGIGASRRSPLPRLSSAERPAFVGHAPDFLEHANNNRTKKGQTGLETGRSAGGLVQNVRKPSHEWGEPLPIQAGAKKKPISISANAPRGYHADTTRNRKPECGHLAVTIRLPPCTRNPNPDFQHVHVGQHVEHVSGEGLAHGFPTPRLKPLITAYLNTILMEILK